MKWTRATRKTTTRSCYAPAARPILVAGVLCCLSIWLAARDPHAEAAKATVSRGERSTLIRRAQIWNATDIGSMDVKAGPADQRGWPPGATVSCDFVDKKTSGKSPKFLCAVGPDDDVKMKIGLDNGEVFGEVAATRLLWVLGFGADHMYPVRVICHGCPPAFGGAPTGRPDERLFDPAAAERRMPGRELVSEDKEGWAWSELDTVDEREGGATRAQRDALKLLAVMIQHTDNKAIQQRLLCLDETTNGSSNDACLHPFMMINDLGLTFGGANKFNHNDQGSVNFERWQKTSVWKDEVGCVGNLPKSWSGTLKNPPISEEGRAFLSGLLEQLSDAQLRDLFEFARFSLRPRAPDRDGSGKVTVEEWAEAFRQKRREIATRHCS
jgi:hypothetical protein